MSADRDAERIARGLTKAQARSLLEAIRSQEEAGYLLAAGYSPGDRLYELELIERLNPGWRRPVFKPTDLGRRVAAVLRSKRAARPEDDA